MEKYTYHTYASLPINFFTYAFFNLPSRIEWHNFALAASKFWKLLPRPTTAQITMVASTKNQTLQNYISYKTNFFYWDCFHLCSIRTLIQQKLSNYMFSYTVTSEKKGKFCFDICATACNIKLKKRKNGNIS